MRIRRRELLASSAAIVFSQAAARADVLGNGVPWMPAAGAPPQPVRPGNWHFFTPAEGRCIEAVVDRLIPPDPDTPGGKDAGVAVFIDRQLAGPFGRAQGHYTDGPFQEGTKEQGPQSRLTPAEQYREVVAALDKEAKTRFGGRAFVDLPDNDKDQILTDLEHGKIAVEGMDAKQFFTTTLIKNTRQGFFADPIYGGNRDMVGWKMVGFPGARYDYSDWIDRHNEHYPHGPVAIGGGPSWNVR